MTVPLFLGKRPGEHDRITTTVLEENGLRSLIQSVINPSQLADGSIAISRCGA